MTHPIRSYRLEPYGLSLSLAAGYVGRQLPEWVMVVGCYFDDSFGERRSAIAGYLAPLTVWESRFVPVWQAFLDSAPHQISEFKAGHCRQPQKGEFETWLPGERDAYYRKAVATLADTSALPEIYGFGAASIVPRTATHSDAQTWEYHALMHCFLTILINVLGFVRRWVPPVTALQFVCDDMSSGPLGLFQDAFQDAKRLVSGDCGFDVSNLDFRSSRLVLPIQAADLLAYETRKELRSRLEVPQRPRSRALVHLIEHRPHIGFYVDQAVMESVEKHNLLPPVLYESAEARRMLPWIENSQLLEPAPILPRDQ